MTTNIHFYQVEKTDVENVCQYEHAGRPFWAQMITMHFSDGGMQAIKLFSDASPESLIAASGKSESHDDLVKALQAIVNEVDGFITPYSVDSHLPMHLIEMARAAIAKAGAA